MAAKRTYNDDQVAAFRAALAEQAASPKESDASTAQVIGDMVDDIIGAINAGYTLKEITDKLQASGLQIAWNTLRTYFAEAHKATKANGHEKRGKDKRPTPVAEKVVATPKAKKTETKVEPVPAPVAEVKVADAKPEAIKVEVQAEPVPAPMAAPKVEVQAEPAPAPVAAPKVEVPVTVKPVTDPVDPANWPNFDAEEDAAAQAKGKSQRFGEDPDEI
jgi:hypothetical protein